MAQDLASIKSDKKKKSAFSKKPKPLGAASYIFVNPKESKIEKESRISEFLNCTKVYQIHLKVALEEYKTIKL